MEGRSEISTATKFINNSMTTLTRPYNKYTCKSHKARYTSLQVHYCSSVPVFLLSQNILLLQASNPRRRPLLWGVGLSHKQNQVPPASSSTSESENQKMSSTARNHVSPTRFLPKGTRKAQGVHANRSYRPYDGHAPCFFRE